MSDDLLNLSLTEVAGLIRRRKVSSFEVTRAIIARAQRVQPKLNCFISLEAEQALKAARAADRAIARKAKVGPLHGVPLAHKDMYYREGKVSTSGSKILRDYRADTTSTAVERLAAAGAIWLGGLNMAEFAANPTGHNEHWGHCRNPWNPAHLTGGSSSGSGSAVGSRACYGSLGSDTGGSVRLPAAMCGVVGIKPTYGRVSRYGILPRAWSLDTVGLLTRTARDCARMLRAISGHDPRDATSSREPVPHYEEMLSGRIRGLRIGVPKNHYHDDIAPDVAKRLEESLAVLRSLGARLVDVTVPDPQAIFLISNTISLCEAATMHAKWMRTRPQDYSLLVRTRVEPGYHIPAPSYLEALNLRPRFTREFVETVLDKYDVLHIPVITMPVPTIAETEVGASAQIPALVARITRNTRPFNYLGTPALSVPAGFTDNGLPAAFQLVGRPFAEGLLLRVAHAYQGETSWHTLMPKL